MCEWRVSKDIYHIFYEKVCQEKTKKKNTIIPGHSIIACVGTVDCDVPGQLFALNKT